MNEILILGAGYSGMAATMGLAGRLKGHDDVQITLVNPQTRFTERLRLHQTASGQTLADLQIPEQLEGTGVDFVQGWVTRLDADARAVRFDDASLALRHPGLRAGQRRRHRGGPGCRRARVHPEQRAGRRSCWPTAWPGSADGTVVVAGSGLTGVESAAEIAEQHPELTSCCSAGRSPERS